MCGIAGAIGPREISRDRIERAWHLMRRRGPDGTAMHVGTVSGNTVTLLFARLAIIDADPRAMQPFQRGDLVIVTNGELYNYIELRDELARLGHTFSTESDTEVMLAAWRQWGEGALDQMEGMWAFALIDATNDQLILCRDRFGEKPLYLWRHGDTLYFGSEPKFIAALAGAKPDVNLDQIRRFLVNGYKSLYKQPQTYFRDVMEVPQAHYITLRGPGPIAPTAYWKLTHRPQQMTAAQALDGARERLETAMRIRLRADVPVAFCLSGGIDSTTLSGLAVKRFGHDLHAFSIIDDDERYDELENIEAQVAFLGCKSHRVQTSTEGFFERLSDLVSYHDMPVATLTYYLHSFLSQAISEAGYRVAISGTAADELYTGYYDHYGFWLAEMSNQPNFPALLDDWRSSYGAYVQNPVLQDPLVFAKTPNERGHIFLNANLFQQWLTEPFNEPFAETHYAGSLLRNRMLNELAHEAVPVILHEDDRNSMRYSVENRSPYLDRHLAEFMFSVPTEHLIKDGYAKYLLRASGKGVVADSVRLDKRKRGFNAPIDSLVDRSDPDTRERLMADSPIFDIVKREAIESFIDGSMADNSFSKNLFSFISSKLFLEHHRDWVP
jgi:asparagine synthase (glutamine-hydrolysing)